MQISFNFTKNFTPQFTSELKPNYQNNTKEISFEAKKVSKKAIKGVAVAAAMSAATLSGIVQAKKDYYQNESKKISTLEAGDLLERYSLDEILEIMEYEPEISLHRKAFSEIIKEKNEDTTKDRFSADECIALLGCLEKIEQYPVAYRLILSAKDDNQTFRFSGYDCEKLLQIADKIDKCQNGFRILKNAKNSDNTMRFDAQDIVQLMVLEGENIENYVNEFHIALRNTNPEDGIKAILSEFKNVKIKADHGEYDALKFKTRLREFQRKIDERIESGEDVTFEDGRTYSNAVLKFIKETMRHSAVRNPYLLLEADYEKDVPLFSESQLYRLLYSINLFRVNLSSLKINEKDKKRRFLNGEQIIEALLRADVKSNTAHTLLVKCAANSRFTPEEFIYLVRNGRIFDTDYYAMSNFEYVSSIKKGKGYKYNAEECLEIIKNLDDYPDIKKKIMKERRKNNSF